MKSQSNSAMPAKHARTIGAIALSVVAVAAIAFSALAYNAALPTMASAEMETMTNEIGPEEQEALIQFARSADARLQAEQQAAQLAEQQAAPDASSGAQTADDQQSAGSAQPEEATPAETEEGLTPADDCKVTINYLENPNYYDPDAEYDENGRRILGQRVLSGMQEGTTLNAWNYVLPLPGHFFFDGWPQNLTVSRDPSQNVIDLIYVKLWNSEYTVNYYLLTGADFTADSWEGALEPDDVKFSKMGSETFTNQRFDALINGDAFEYKLNELYVIDSYPAQIRLGTDPDNNVINVLYMPQADMPTGDGSKPDLPDDTVVDYDQLITTLPDDVLVDDGVLEDFVGSDIDRGELDVTDEMLANPVSKEDAERTIQAYNTGLHNGSLSQTGDGNMVVVWTLVGIAAVAAVAIVVAVVVRRRKTHEGGESR